MTWLRYPKEKSNKLKNLFEFNHIHMYKSMCTHSFELSHFIFIGITYNFELITTIIFT